MNCRVPSSVVRKLLQDEEVLGSVETQAGSRTASTQLAFHTMENGRKMNLDFFPSGEPCIGSSHHFLVSLRLPELKLAL